MDFPITSVSNSVCPPSGSRFLPILLTPLARRLGDSLGSLPRWRDSCGWRPPSGAGACSLEATTGTLGRVRRVAHPGAQAEPCPTRAPSAHLPPPGEGVPLHRLSAASLRKAAPRRSDRASFFLNPCSVTLQGWWWWWGGLLLAVCSKEASSVPAPHPQVLHWFSRQQPSLGP